MLGTTPKKPTPHAAKRARRSGEKALEFRVSLPNGDDGATARLARKIRESIARTIEQESREEASIVTAEGATAAPRDAARAPARETPTGCGAWWAF